MCRGYYANYHTHTYRCKHASGAVADYAKVGVENEWSILGFSDHAPYPGDPFGRHMDFRELPEYIAEVKACRASYQGRMQVLAGLEAEFLPGYTTYYEKLKTEYGAEYLILGQHFFYDDWTGTIVDTYTLPSSKLFLPYAKSVCQAMSTGLFSYVAHPDLFCMHDFPVDENFVRACSIIIDAAEHYGVPLELNANGIRRGKVHFADGDRYMYPNAVFFSMVQARSIPVIIGVDCHLPEDLAGKHVDEAYQLADAWHLNRIDVLNI